MDTWIQELNCYLETADGDPPKNYISIIKHETQISKLDSQFLKFKTWSSLPKMDTQT